MGRFRDRKEHHYNRYIESKWLLQMRTNRNRPQDSEALIATDRCNLSVL
jgi:hypothetical protein